MRLSVRSLAAAGALLWGGMILLLGIGHELWPPYGRAFLDVLASVYPGYEVGEAGSVVVGTLYGLLDGAIAGALLAWLYNLCARPAARSG